MDAAHRVASDLGDFADWVDHRVREGSLFPIARDPREVRRLLGEALGRDDEPSEVRLVREWEDDGLLGREVAWSPGFGPETRAWVLRPAGEALLPGVVAMHCHSHFTYFGKEKIADGPEPAHRSVRALRAESYSNVAWANELARRGFVVMIHDVFLWGSRRFPIPDVDDQDVEGYNRAAIAHEHVVAKYAAALGTSVAAMVAREDRMALSVLAGLPGVRPARLGVIGFSGGGLRAALLNATSERVGAAVVTAMMTSMRPLLDAHVVPHTWMLFDPAFAHIADLPAIAGARLPSPLLVQYGRSDPLFPAPGTEQAHRAITELSAQRSGGYHGSFHEAGHEFSAGLQDEAFDWLEVLRD